MASSVQLSFRYQERDYVRAVRAHHGSRARLCFDIFAAIALISVGVSYWQVPRLHWLGVAAISAAGLFGLLLIATLVIIPRLMFRRELKFRDEYSIAFSPDIIHFRTQKIDSTIQWSFYSREIGRAHV